MVKVIEMIDKDNCNKDIVLFCDKCFKLINDCQCDGKAIKCIDFIYHAFINFKPSKNK